MFFYFGFICYLCKVITAKQITLNIQTAYVTD
jgi:hypothetical protein